MNKQPDWITKLKKKFRMLHADFQPKRWSLRNYDLFFEIEYGLRLHELIINDVTQRDCKNTWALISGYFLPDIHNDPEIRHACALARTQIRYVGASTTWIRWLKWYSKQSNTLRLYDINLETGIFEQTPNKIVLREDRLKIYDQALITPPKPEIRKEQWAEAGSYNFKIDGDPYRISIPPALANLVLNVEVPASLPTKKARLPISVTFEKLELSAEELDKLTQGERWVGRLGDFKLALVDQNRLTHDAQAFTINRLFHLVGMVGAGKSTLIRLLTYYLVKHEKLHITIMVNTVVESIQMAQWFEQVGISAAPALGSQRGAHREKYGLANALGLKPENVFRPNDKSANDPALRWLTAPCALSGATPNRSGPIPAGKEPCYSLHDENDERYLCPVLPVCPVHQASRDLVQNRRSQVWVVNPASFLYSAAPQSLSKIDMKLLEAVYRVSDLLIIDEADRVQVQWDAQFAPTNDLFGDDDALLDFVHRKVSAQSVGHRGRQRMANDSTRQLTFLDDQTNILSGLLSHLLIKHKELAEWAKKTRLVNSSMYDQLAKTISRRDKNSAIDESVYRDLAKTFEQFWKTPLARSGGELTEWVYTVLRDDQAVTKLFGKLERWLAKQLPWRVDPKRLRGFAYRLGFCLLLTATNRRIDDIIDRWATSASEFGTLASAEKGPPDEYVTLVPDPPLGRILGNHYVASGTEPGGVMKYTRYRGIGRWLLLNFHSLYANVDGTYGPHVLLTSATSWAPGSPQFHLAKMPDAVLSPPADYLEAIAKSIFRTEFVNDQRGLISVSGRSGDDRDINLAKLVRYLAVYTDDEPSRLEQELVHWRKQGTDRRILLVVGSYSEARQTIKYLREFPKWRDNVRRMAADDDPEQDLYSLRRGSIETLKNHNAEILVAPIQAIQRGFNILDELGGALLGTAFFLVRPYPIPHDLSQHIMGVNAWALRKLENEWSYLPAEYAQHGITAVRRLRSDAYHKQWVRRLASSEGGLDGMDEDLYHELLWNQFVVVWQTIGRLLRQGRPARIFFMDAKFMPQDDRRKMLRGWLERLGDYIEPTSRKPLVQQELARQLYGVVYQAMKRDLGPLMDENKL